MMRVELRPGCTDSSGRRLDRVRLWLAAMLCLTVSPVCLSAADTLKAHTVVEKNELYLGESLRVDIRVDGHDEPEDPTIDTGGMFSVRHLGGSKNNSTSISIINNQMTRVVQRGYVLSYRFTPKKSGVLVIPAITVKGGGESTRTQPVTVRVIRPQEGSDHKLRFVLSSKTCFVGQPVQLDVTLYSTKRMEGEVQVLLPLLTDKRFSIMDPDQLVEKWNQGKIDRRKHVGLKHEDSYIVGARSLGQLGGKDYATIHFRRVLIPKQAGVFNFSQGTFVCHVVVGYRRKRDPFFGGYDMFGSKEAIRRKVVVPGNTPSLQVLPLPEKGKPAGFSGLIGVHRVDTELSNTTFSVGEPINLTLRVTAPVYVNEVRLPPLHQMPALKDFKIPEEMAAGKIEGKTITFTQSIRARHDSVKAFPAIELPYFDVSKGVYSAARSKPIPIQIKATHMVTARDAEGRSGTGPATHGLESWAEGIAHNYVDLSVLENQAVGPRAWLGSSFWSAVVILPPLLYLVLLLTTVAVRRRNANPAALRSRKAFGELARQLKKVARVRETNAASAHSDLLLALRTYLGSKLDLPGGALTVGDVRGPLAERGVSSGTLMALAELFDECEASRYAGQAAGGQSATELVDRVRRVADQIERSLRP